MSKSSGEPDLITIYTSMGPLGAEVIKSKLESAGIPVLLSYQSAGAILGVIVDGLGEVRVQVPRDMADEARALIEPLTAGDDEWDDEDWDDEEWPDDDIALEDDE
jgi:hypothetical protein